ncbi:P60-like protein [Tuber magnatum]|uniref:Ribosome biogenesis protein NOP53 n=1 Tax=Tuber magnatum TaxID=42249 RepID=A0A317T0C2_9PEZI|nr:P60-like protein [Tuber magnatum]
MASRQPSRTWNRDGRKNVDTTDARASLESLRKEIIQGKLYGGAVMERSNNQLFTLDTTGKAATAKSFTINLKSDEILSSCSALPAVEGRKRVHSTTASTPRGAGILPVKKRRSNGDPWVTPTAWPEDKLAEKYRAKGLTFLAAPAVVKEPKTLKQPPAPLTQTGKSAPAVRLPEAGISYNTEFQQWDMLLRTKGEKAVGEEMKRLEEAKERERIKPVAAIPEPEPTSRRDSDSGSDGETPAIGRKQPKGKTQAQRNKQLGRKAQQLPMLRANRRKPEADEKNPKPLRKRRFGKVGIGNMPLEIQLPEELADSLRTLKPERSLLSDRFRSMRERGVVESRVSVTERRMYAKKVCERWRYKDFT